MSAPVCSPAYFHLPNKHFSGILKYRKTAQSGFNQGHKSLSNTFNSVYQKLNWFLRIDTVRTPRRTTRPSLKKTYKSEDSFA
jgi:hypothetical protein